ncbi:MAG: serine hydrolase [Planctomycetales bacterium]|nr:serine hydrolase [Planctomycetales bacterium]MCA9169080.1 serine hydrolase [Planctomycetales bacterium]
MRSQSSWLHLVVSITIAAAVTTSLLATEPAPLRAKIDPLAQPYLDNDIVWGMAIGVLQDDQPTVFGYGRFSETDDRVPDGQTMFEIGSITKVLTGLLLADAVTQDYVTLQDPANKWLPEGDGTLTYEDQPIRLVDLSTHVSGLPRLPTNMRRKNPKDPYADYTQADLYEFVRTHKLSRARGAKMEYSNLAVGLLGQLLANAEKTTYEQLLKDRLVSPLKLTNTTITLTDDQRRRLAPPHTADRQPATNWAIPTLAGAGAVRSNCDDVLSFAAAYLHPPESDLGKAIELSWKVHQQPVAAGDFAMALGWHLARDGSTRWHNGQTGGYHSMLLVSRSLNAAVVVLTNTATGEIDKLAEDILRMQAGIPVEPRRFDKAVSVEREIMLKYVGKYQLTPDFIFTVTESDGRLMVGVTGQPTFEVFARSDTEWFYKVVDATLTFQMNDAGKCTAVELFQNGVRQTASRVE